MSSDYNHCISIKDLRKSYKNNPHAVNGISFNVDYGKVFGILGPNGAGKTTTIKMLTTLIRPASGSIEIFGKDLLKSSRDIKKRIGVVMQKPSFEARLTVQKSLDLYANMWGVGGEEKKKRVTRVLEIFDLNEIKNEKNEDLSIGQRRRVQVAREFLHEIDLLFLDEPTVGLDPNARRTLLDYVKSQVKAGLTVVFTTHIIDEAEYLCDEIAIMNNGNIIALDKPLELKQKYSGMRFLEITLKGITAESVVKIAKQDVAKSDLVEIIDVNILRISSLDPEKTLVKLIESFSKSDIHIDNISISSPSLEETFLKIISNEKQQISNNLKSGKEV